LFEVANALVDGSGAYVESFGLQKTDGSHVLILSTPPWHGLCGTGDADWRQCWWG
jgi:hypothetical protein